MRLRGFISRLRAALGRPASRSAGDWAFHHTAGIKAYVQGDYDGAERQFLAALKRVETLSAADKCMASSLNNLGLVYKRQRKLKKAEAHFRRALQTYEKTAPASPQFARILYHLATLRHVRKDYTEAESLYQRCIVLTKRTLGESHPKLAKRLKAYARLLRHMNRNERASEMHARAAAIKAKHGTAA